MERLKLKFYLIVGLLLLLAQCTIINAEPVGMGFTYQGQLTDADLPANGFYDFEFKLFDAPAEGNQVGPTLSFFEVFVEDGYFMVELEFPNEDPLAFQPQGLQYDKIEAFQEIWGGGEARWLEIAVRQAHDTIDEWSTYTTLSPRTKITPTPYALHALSSGTGSGPGPLVGTDNYIPRWLGTTDLENSVIYQTDAGNIGIGPGMTNPEERLDVSWSGGVNTRIGRYNYLGSCFSSATMVLGNNVRARTDGVRGIVVGQAHDVYGYRAITMSMDGIQFYGRTGAVKVGDPLDAATERMRITNDGKVGIGTTTPRSILEVVGEAGNPVTTFTTFPASGSALSYGTQGIGLNLVRKSTGTWEAAGDGANNAGAAIFGSIGHEGLRFVTVESTGSVNQTFTDSQIMEKVRMVITSQGRVGIGTTDPIEKLDVDGTARLRGLEPARSSTVTVVADIHGRLYRQSSSSRYKTNIQNLEDDANKVLELRPVRFQWKTTGQDDIGLIAEEVDTVARDLVIYDQEGKPDAVKYDRVSLYLLKLVKDLKSENESLKQRLDTLEKKIDNIEWHDSSIMKEVLQ